MCDLLNFLLEEDLLYSLLPQLASGSVNGAAGSGDAGDKKEAGVEVQGGGAAGLKTKRRVEGSAKVTEADGSRAEFAAKAAIGQELGLGNLSNDMPIR